MKTKNDNNKEGKEQTQFSVQETLGTASSRKYMCKSPTTPPSRTNWNWKAPTTFVNNSQIRKQIMNLNFNKIGYNYKETNSVTRRNWHYHFLVSLNSFRSAGKVVDSKLAKLNRNNN